MQKKPMPTEMKKYILIYLVSIFLIISFGVSLIIVWNLSEFEMILIIIPFCVLLGYFWLRIMNKFHPFPSPLYEWLGGKKNKPFEPRH